jgi:circadian clock protein KaiC
MERLWAGIEKKFARRAYVVQRAAALGLDIAPHVKSGTITIQQLDPVEVSPGEFAGRVLAAVEAGCKLVLIDTLNGYLNAMPGEKCLNLQLHELSAYLNQQGVLSIFILAQHGLVTNPETPVDLSYLADTVVTLRYFEAAGAVKQAIAVVKKRSGPHERTIREFALEPVRGLRIGAPLKEFRGVLTGIPEFHGDAAQMMK